MMTLKNKLFIFFRGKMKGLICVIVLGSISISNAISQNAIPLSIDVFFDKIKAAHPLAQQASVQNDIADAELLKARGKFDPVLSGSLNQKNFADKEYFSLLNSEIKIPIWPGLDIKGGYEINRGAFLGPEDNTPAGGLAFGGISISLGQGLLIDERRAGIRTAEILQKSASARQSELMNDLLFEASIVYWEWYRAYRVNEIYKLSLKNAVERFEAIKFNAAIGERPEIDTVEAKIQIQNIRVGLNQAMMDYRNAGIILSGYIWENENKNSEPDSTYIPQDLNQPESDLDELMSEPNLIKLIGNHPYLEQIRQKINQLDIERKLKQDKLKPVINLQYNPIIEPIGNNFLTNFSFNNYKWGVEFKMPLFLRKERGDIKITELKIKENELILTGKFQALLNKLQVYINAWQATLEQIEIFEESVRLYEQMYISEKRLFDIGESSLFLVNSREQSYINARIKLAEMVAKNRISYYSIFYFAGKLGV
ncbi:MAG: TolC family protein [Saprospiraceae bacterium]